MRTKIRRRPNGRWYLFSVDEDGEHSHGGYRTKREATSAAAALRTDAARGRYVTPHAVSVAEYLEREWLPSRENAELSPNSRDVERVIVRSWIVPHIGSIPLQKLSARDLDKLYGTLRERGGRGGTPLRGKSIRNAHVLLSKACGDAVRRGYLVTNPVQNVDPPRRDDSIRRTAWTADEARAFLAVADGDRLAAVWQLLLATGLRRGELCGLRWADIDLDAGAVEVRRQRLIRADKGTRWDEDRTYLRETTKSHKARRVRFSDVTATALRRWKLEQAEEQLAFGIRLTEASDVVAEPDGTPINPATLLHRWKRVVTAAKVPEIGLHGARHTHAELSLGAGVRLDVVSRQLGHSSIAITADVYGHPDDDAAAEAATKLGAILEGGR
jgi:integrase